MRRRVNKDMYHTAYTIDYDKKSGVLGTTPKKFRYRNIRKGDFRTNPIIQNWIMTDASNVIVSDTQHLFERGEALRGDKVVNTLQKVRVFVAELNPDLELGAYDPIFGTKLPGVEGDVRSVDFFDVVSGATYYFNVIGIESYEGTVNVLQFDENDETTTTVEEVTYNQALKLEDDTVKVKIWANDILLKNDEIITTYRIGEESFEYEARGEVVEFEIQEDDTQMLGAIRGRKNINFIVMKVS